MRVQVRLPGSRGLSRERASRPDVAEPSPRRARRRWVPWLAAAVLFAAAAGATLGYFLQFDVSDVRGLEDYNPPQMTRVLAIDGVEVDSFAEQRRILIDYRDIPAVFRHALLAIEDVNFERHTGIDFKALLRAAWRDVISMTAAEGGSTLTQQLARNLFLHPDKTIRRKIQEAILAVEIERQFTKDEILRFYCNQIYMGHGRYGIEAAARFFYDKPARELSLSEAATLAGIIQRPESLSPLRNPKRARERRNLVLRRMAEVGFLTREQAAAAQQEPLLPGVHANRRNLAPYFVEEVRRWMQQRYGSSTLYKEGLEVSTTLDRRLQSIANRAVDEGLRQLDKRQGWRGVAGRVPAGESLEAWVSPDWERDIEPGAVREGVVVEVAPGRARVRVGGYSGILGADEIRWTGKKDPRSLLRAGDLVRVRVAAVGEDGTVELALEQDPLVEAALVALDPASGAVQALVGGFDFERSEYDRATQAHRQTGSAFKPFVYAAALSSGWSAADTIVDEPTVFLDPHMPKPYQPENYKHIYHGQITLRTALEESVNIAAVKLLDAIGYDTVIETARRLGIRSKLEPYPSLALGAFEITLMELTSAYGAFANQGVLVEPHFVEVVRNRDGMPVDEIEPAVHDAVSPQIAFVMNRLLAGVISDGTGRAAATLPFPVAGKTGTTDGYTDAWFIGYSPRLCVGVWVGFDEPRSMGSTETGAHAALPIWLKFMEEAQPGLPTEDFPLPPGVSILSIDRLTGLKANRQAGCQPVLSEAFLSGTEPSDYCSIYLHQKLRLPYTFHAYPLDDRGELSIPADELDRLLELEPNVVLRDGGRSLALADESASLPLKLLPAGSGSGLAFSPDHVGKDGRPARAIQVGTSRR